MNPSAEDVVAHIFTSDNPATGSKPPPQIAWAIFEHGTAFFSVPTDALPTTATTAAIADAARAALRELGPVHPGSPSADFNPTRLDGWYPDQPVWFVGFDHPSIATVMVADGTSLVVGLLARRQRDLDHDAQNVVAVRGFGGSVWRP
jgi:hypothetical protein